MSLVSRRVSRAVVAGVSTAVLVVSGGAPAGARVLEGADLAVDLAATGTLLLPGANYQVTVTNNGPSALTSATVVVALHPGAYSGPGSPPCVFSAAADTLTCSFGPLSAGGSATLTGTVFFSLPSPPTPVDATATRTAGVPPDPVPGNDTDTVHCVYKRDSGIFPPPPTVRC